MIQGVRTTQFFRNARLTRISAVLGESTVHSDTMGLEVLTKKLLTAAAVEAFSAEFRVVCNNSISNTEPFDLWADSSNDTNGLMPWNQRELRNL